MTRQIRLAIPLLLALTTTIAFAQKPADTKPEEVDKEYLPLVKQLKERDAKVRAKAATELGEKGEAAASTATALCDAIMDTSPRVTQAALVALEKVRPDLYKYLSVIVLDKSRTRRFEAIAELGGIAEKATPTKKILLAQLRAESVTLKPIWDLYSSDTPRVGQISGINIQRSDSAILVLLSVVEQIDADNADAHKVRKTLAGVGNKLPESRLEAIDALMRWAGEDEMRRKEVLPIIGSTLNDNSLLLAGIPRLASYGKLSKGYLPTLKKLKLAAAEVVREAATRAVDAIEEK